MAFAKVLKTRQYFKRYQTKFRRRRENKTDYYARKRMVRQDCNKYGTPKYRLIARFSNTKVITQIAYSTLQGDVVICEANSFELKKHGLTTGLKSYAASYATGLLLARRLLKQFGLDQTYKGTSTTNGDNYDVTAIAETYQNAKRPFKAILDIGLTRSTVGNRVYAVLKGALGKQSHLIFFIDFN
jgi:large subunit ribosomal protein L5e